jgi:hypothetical protein
LYKRQQQPFIQENIFNVLNSKHCKTIHVDKLLTPGVDEVGDVTDPAFIKKLGTYDSDALICSNILEHLEDRKIFCDSLSKVMKSGSILLVTGPYEFPYHEDPIDTMFRPTPAELKNEFPKLACVMGEIVPCGNYTDLIWYKIRNKEPVYRKAQSIFKTVKLAIRPSEIKSSQRKYRKISAVCAIFKKL